MTRVGIFVLVPRALQNPHLQCKASEKGAIILFPRTARRGWASTSKRPGSGNSRCGQPHGLGQGFNDTACYKGFPPFGVV